MATISESDRARIAAAFERDGFLVVRGLWDAALCAQVKAAIASEVARHGHHGGVLVGLAAREPFFARLVRERRLLDALDAAIGPEIEFLSDKVAFKSAVSTTGSPWHQDWPYWEGAHKLSVWVALDRATPANGCLKLLPGSHRSAAIHDGVAAPGEAFGKRVRDNAVDESLAVTVECEIGDAVFFHDLTLHASHPNQSGADRWAWIGTYRPLDGPDLDYDWAVARAVVAGRRQQVGGSGP